MPEVIISAIPSNLEVHYNNAKIAFPEAYVESVEAHWKILTSSGKNFRRGDVYHIVRIEQQPDSVHIFAQLSDYAHYMYTIAGNYMHPNACRVIYTSALLVTADDYLVFGQMSTSTSSPDRMQCIGGGIDKEDILGDRIDLVHSIKTEIAEEIGLSVDNQGVIKNLVAKYLKSGGENRFLAAIFFVELSLNRDQLEREFAKYSASLVSRGVTPEFSRLVYVARKPEEVEMFFASNTSPVVDYLPLLLEIETGMKTPNSLEIK